MEYFENLTEQAKEGFESPLKAYIELKKEIDRLTKLQDTIKMEAIREAANEPEAFEKFGAKITYVSQAGSRWDFSNITDWKDVKNQLKEIEDKGKAAFQAWKKGSQYIDENGEVIQPASYKEGNPTIQIRIK